MPAKSGNTPIVRDLARMLEQRCRRGADVLGEEPAEFDVGAEWNRVAKQLAKEEVVKNVVILTTERLQREPGTIRPRKNGDGPTDAEVRKQL